MSQPEASAQPVVSAQVEAMLRDLRDGATLLVLPALYALGAGLFFGASWWFPDPSRGALLALLPCMVAGAVWGLRRWHSLAAAWALVAGCIAVDLVAAKWSGLGAAVTLLIVPTGLAALCVSLPGSMLAAAACSLLALSLPAALLPADAGQRVTTVVAVWSTVGLIWLAMHQLQTALQWSWSGYQQSRGLLEEARDYRMRLKQTLQDLQDANLQLTRLNRLAHALRQTAEEARRAKEQFVANVSHELRTPLNMIIGFTEMVVRAPHTYGGQIPPALLADLSVIRRNSQHLSSLIDDVLDLSQIESSRMALVRERVALPEVVDAAVTAVRPLFDSRGLVLETEVAADLPAVFCDRTRIREVLLNLLSNAGRFTEQGGVHVHVWREEDDVVFSVADTGPGIAPADAGRIFEPFEQVDGSIRRRFGGSGLGLVVSKGFVELHGGKMWMESQVGSGTTFYFRLPIDAPPPLDSGVSRWFNPYWHYEERTRPSAAPAVTVHPRFVVLESGNALQRLLGRYLDGPELAPVGNLGEAMQELARNPAQALLVNDGSVSDMLRELSQSGILPDWTPAIICSVPGVYGAAGALGVADYLVKPISREALLGALDRLQLRGRTVLVVDDEPEAVRLFQRMLATAEPAYRVLRATSGNEALSILREQRVDAILLDLAMPDTDGFRLLERRDQDAKLRGIPVVVTSARDPAGQPIVAGALAAIRGAGLAVPQLLAAIQALSTILSPIGQVADPAPRGGSPA